MELYVESEARLSFLGEVGRYLSPQQELHSLNKVREKLNSLTATVDSRELEPSREIEKSSSYRELVELSGA